MADPILVSRQPARRALARAREQTALDVVLRCFAATVGADTAMLLGYDRAGKAELLSAWGLAESHSTAPWVSGTFLGAAMEADGASLEAAPGRNGGSGGPRWCSVAAPIRGPSCALGALYAGFAAPSDLSAEALRWSAESHASLAALCMDGGDEVAATLRSSGVDQLTGCLRYERVVEMLNAEIERSARGGLALSCCFLDLDGFKAINDEHGHLEGNRVLASAGQALRSVSRPYDGVGRFGGDEFVIVLPQTPAADAERAIERMRWRIIAGVYEATGRIVEVSAGIAQWETGDSPSRLLEAADQALQRAKAAGGARVESDVPALGRLDGLRELIRSGVRRPGQREERGNGVG